MLLQLSFPSTRLSGVIRFTVMAPDRGRASSPESQNISAPSRGFQDQDDVEYDEVDAMTELRRQRSETRRFIASHASEGQNFTLRGILVGLGVGLIICFSNMYFGLQTGWVSSMVCTVPLSSIYDFPVDE